MKWLEPAVLGVAQSSCATQLMKSNALTCHGSTAFRDVSAWVYLSFTCSLCEAGFLLLWRQNVLDKLHRYFHWLIWAMRFTWALLPSAKSRLQNWSVKWYYREKQHQVGEQDLFRLESYWKHNSNLTRDSEMKIILYFYFAFIFRLSLLFSTLAGQKYQ